MANNDQQPPDPGRRGFVLAAGGSGVPSSESKLPRVAPGDPERSYLMHKLRGTHLAVGGSGAAMPFNADTGSSRPARRRASPNRGLGPRRCAG